MPYNVHHHFKDFFLDIDSNKERYGIKEYTVSCSTLEEVFVKVGKKEKALNEKFFQFENEDEVTHMPIRKNASFCSKYCAMTKFNFESSFWSGNTALLTLIYIVIMVAMSLFCLAPIDSKNPSINFSDVGSVYTTLAPLELMYNPYWNNNGKENKPTTDFFDDLMFKTYDESVLKPDIQETWQWNKNVARFDAFLENLSSDIDTHENKIGAIYMFENYDEIHAIIFANMSSSASTPTMGSLVLQTIA